MIYQAMFATLTPILAVPSSMILLLAGSAPKGWLYVLGGLDFAGGGPVHIAIGSAGLAISIYLGKRKGYGTETLAFRPFNTSYVILGTALLWFGWFGFNGGSALAANFRAVNAMVVTNIAASIGGLVWMFLDWTLERKWSSIGFCSGVVSGLVAITPCSGFVGPPAALAIGFVAGAVCQRATSLKFLFRADDALDLFSLHAVGGFVGNIMCALFAQKSIAALDGTIILGGFIDHHYMQLAYQLAESVTIMAYAFGVTYLICMIFHFIPGLSLRSTLEEEELGTDESYLGESVYEDFGPGPDTVELGMSHHRDQTFDQSQHFPSPQASARPLVNHAAGLKSGNSSVKTLEPATRKFEPQNFELKARVERNAGATTEEEEGRDRFD